MYSFFAFALKSSLEKLDMLRVSQTLPHTIINDLFSKHKKVVFGTYSYGVIFEWGACRDLSS